MDERTITAARGMRRRFSIPVAGESALVGTVLRGMADGPRVVLTAGVHGCEYVGVQTLLRIERELDAAKLHGEVVIVPVVNRAGFFASVKFVVPGDGKNLNRCFPGSARGSETERLAAAVERLLYPGADFLLDLHSGDGNELADHFVYFPVAAGEAVERSARAAAAALHLPYRVASSSRSGLYSYAAQCGVPALLMECGGKGEWSEEQVDACKACVYELLAHLGVLAGRVDPSPQQEIVRAQYFAAEAKGLWYPAAEAGEHLAQGALLGELRDMEDNVLQRCLAPYDGVVLYHTVSLGALPGVSLVAFGAWEKSPSSTTLKR